MSEPQHQIKTMIAFANEDGSLYACPTIRHEGKLWLASKWKPARSEGCHRPARIVCLDGLRYQPTKMQGVTFVLSDPIPRKILEGPTPPKKAAGYVVIDNPDIEFRFVELH
jgi:hypothetical protein